MGCHATGLNNVPSVGIKSHNFTFERNWQRQPLNFVMPHMNSIRIVDQRLLGVWRSDKAQTLSEWVFSLGTSAETSAKIEAWFGKLVLRYTPARVFTQFEGDKTVCPYRVIAADEQSVTIVRRTEGRDEIQHIHFSGENSYWISCCRNREFFSRVA
jgi:hypothetical protein